MHFSNDSRGVRGAARDRAPLMIRLVKDSFQKSHNDLNLDESRSQRPNFGHGSIGHL